MKKRILALLLAGLLTASLAACTSTDHRGDGPQSGGTEANQTKRPVVTTAPPPAVVTWQDADDYVFVVDESVKLRVSTDTVTGAISVEGATKLHRIKVSNNNVWSAVEYNGKEYYVATQSLTTDDLTGESFVTCTPTVMYINSPVNLRKYASSTAPISVSIKQLAFNEEVTVVAKGEKWYKVKYTEEDASTSYYFVFASYVSAEKVKDHSEYFTPCAETNMYVIVDLCNIRSKPVVDDTSYVGSRKKGDIVVVVGTGTGDYEAWSRIKVADPVKEGDPQTYSYYYISNSCISATDPGSITDKMTLENFLKGFTGFTACESKTMYLLAEKSLYVRSTPVFEGTDNLKDSLSSGKTEFASIKVVATGTADGIACYVIELAEGDFGFVSASSKYWTSNSNGTPAAPTLPEILQEYKSFEICEEKPIWATGKVNCYSAPKSSDTIPHTLALGDQVTVVAKGKEGTADAVWYIIQLEDGTLYFAGATLFTTTQPAG